MKSTDVKTSTKGQEHYGSLLRPKFEHHFDTGWAWVVNIGVFMIMFITMGWLRIYGIIFVAIQEETNSTTFQISWVGTANSMCFNFFAPVGCVIAARYSVRLVVMLGGLLVSVGLGLAFFVNTLGMYILTIGIIQGIGAAFVYVPSVIMLGYYFRKRMGLATGIAFAGSSISQLIVPPVTAYLLEEYSMQGTMLIIAAASFNICACGAAFYPVDTASLLAADRALLDLAKAPRDADPETVTKDTIEDEDDRVDDDVFAEKPMIPKPLPLYKRTERKPAKSPRRSFTRQISGSFRRIRRLSVTLNTLRENRKLRSAFGQWKTPELWVLMCSYSIGACIFNVMMKYTPPLALSRGLGHEDVAFILSLSGLPDLIFRVGSGLVSDVNFVATRLRRYRVFAMSLLMIAVACSLLPFMRTYAGFMATMFLIGASTGMFFTISSIACFDLMGADKYNIAYGWMMFMTTFSSVIDSVAVAQLIDVTGEYLASFLLCGGLSLFAGILVLTVPCCQKPRLLDTS